jgi:DNA processing protein
LSDRQRIAWLRLIRTPNVGPASFRELVRQCGSAEAALEMLPDLVRRGGDKRTLRIPTVAQAEVEMQRARAVGAAFVAVGEPEYPAALKRMDQPPPLLAVKGDPAVFGRPPVAIVGARNASLAGIKFARQLAADLGADGYVVVSGLARGIDTGAHKGSLPTGTIAAVAGGLDRPYPPENAALMEDIAAHGGAVVSEMPFGWEPRAQDFPRRNRIIAGIALGLVVIEAAKRSGSLISARLAGEMGRIVFAVPGSPLDPRAEGSNGLLKDGAILVTDAADVIDHIAPLLGRPGAPSRSMEEPVPDLPVAQPGDTDRQKVIEALGATPVGIDDLIRHTELHPAQLQLILLELDLAGRLERHSGGAVSLVFGA